MKKNQNRDVIVQALNEMIKVFTSHDGETSNDVISNGLKPFAEAAGIDRVIVFRLLEGKTNLNQVYLWQGKSIPLDKELIELPYIPATMRFLEILTSGGCINTSVKKLAREEELFLSHFGIKSIYMVPIFTMGKFWGIIGLENHTHYRGFDEDYLDLLRSAANLCADTVVRDEMEREIAAANELNYAMLDAAPIGFAIIDTDFNVRNCNDTILNILGYTKLYYKEQFFNLSPEFQPDGSNSMEKAVEFIRDAFNGENQAFEWTHRSYSGEYIPFEISLIRKMYKGEYVLHAYQYDLRNLKRMERAIADAEELTKAITEASPIPFMQFDENLQPLGCNEAMMMLLGCTDKKYIMDNYWNHFVPELQFDGSNSYEKAKQCMNNIHENKQNKFEWMQYNINQEPIPMENTMTQITHLGKKYFISYKYDLRSTKAMMESIRKQSEMLKEALDKATIASKAKGEFLSNMSHEMRTPLNAIIGMTAIGRNTDNVERKDYALDKVMDASTHLLGVINDILDMSKIEANKFELSPAEFSFEMMLHRVANFINYRIEEKKQKLTVHIDPSIPNFLVGDDQRIAQVITNLLANAVKFTPEGGAVSLETKFLGQENRPGTEGSLCTLKISIIDTGIGISAEQQKRLFESFQQAENSTARKYGGTGLGLSISKSIVEMMGGRIWVNSEAGKGSVFSFTLQVKRGQEKQKRLNEAVNLGDIRIMALDNDPDILIQFREIMQGFGISCDTAINPAEAHHLIKKNGPYNIYFIDSKVQGINCLELAEIFKAKIKRPGEAIVIMISPAEWKEIEDDAKKAGIDKFLSKPLFPSIIMDLINEVLGVKRQVEKKNEMDISGLFTGHRIMLVEDVEVNREIVQELLSPTNLQIDCAANGLEAVRMFAEAPEKYGMIFMDVHMPELDGYEATRRIRKIEARLHPELKRIPIVAMTANVFREDTEKCLNAGMDDHVGKPLDFNLVLDKLHQYLPARESSNVPEKVDHLIPDFV